MLKSLQTTKPFLAVSTSTSSSRRRTHSRNVVVAALDGNAALAVSQQAIAFAAVVGGEAAFTGLTAPADQKGRPSIPTTLIGTGGTVAAAVLVSQGQGVGTAGCVAGVLVSAFMLYTYGMRVKDTPYNPLDWPGAKTWPAVMGLISFFALAAFSQGYSSSD